MKALEKIESNLQYAKRTLDRMSTGNLSHHRNACLRVIAEVLNILRVDGKEIISQQAKQLLTDSYFKGFEDALTKIRDNSYRMGDKAKVDYVVKGFLSDIPTRKKIWLDGFKRKGKT